MESEDVYTSKREIILDLIVNKLRWNFTEEHDNESEWTEEAFERRWCLFLEHVKEDYPQVTEATQILQADMCTWSSYFSWWIPGLPLFIHEDKPNRHRLWEEVWVREGEEDDAAKEEVVGELVADRLPAEEEVLGEGVTKVVDASLTKFTRDRSLPLIMESGKESSDWNEMIEEDITAVNVNVDDSETKGNHSSSKEAPPASNIDEEPTRSKRKKTKSGKHKHEGTNFLLTQEAYITPSSSDPIVEVGTEEVKIYTIFMEDWDDDLLRPNFARTDNNISGERYYTCLDEGGKEYTEEEMREYIQHYYAPNNPSEEDIVNSFNAAHPLEPAQAYLLSREGKLLLERPTGCMALEDSTGFTCDEEGGFTTNKLALTNALAKRHCAIGPKVKPDL